MLETRTPREAIVRLTAVMSRHCTHELFALVPAPGGVTFRERINLSMSAETRHVQHQYVAALVRALCLATGFRGEPFSRVELAPHQAAGLGHLTPWLGPNLVPARGQMLSILVPAAVIDRPFQLRPFPHLPRDHPPRGAAPADAWSAIRGRGTYAGTAQVVVDAMLDEGEPSARRLAAASGTSLRTVQRRLEAEGTSFSRLLDDARQRRALRALANGSSSISDIAVELGYSAPPAFTRAVRRWTSEPPMAHRARPRPGEGER